MVDWRASYTGAGLLSLALACFSEQRTLGLDCTEDASCGQGQICHEGICVPTSHCAYSGAECEAGLFCDPCSTENDGCVPHPKCPPDDGSSSDTNTTPGPGDTDSATSTITGTGDTTGTTTGTGDTTDTGDGPDCPETPCTDHSDCPCSACRFWEVGWWGACMARGRVWVDKDDPNCGDGPGDEDSPFCTIADALATVDRDGAVIVVREAATPYTETVSTTESPVYPLVLLGEGRPVISSPSDGVIAPDGGLILAGVEISGSSGHGVRYDPDNEFVGPCVWIDDSRISGNAGAGIRGDADCPLHIRRSEIVLNEEAGINIAEGGELRMENSVVSRNMGTGLVMMYVNGLQILYSTIVDNQGPATQQSIVCGPGAEAGQIRNSIVVADGLESIDCPGLEASYSAVDDSDVLGATNLKLDEFDAGWFQDVSLGDLHLREPATTPFVDVALWTEGDPTTDLDGDPRPSTPDTPDYAGADEP
jgi:hypothetical protein